MPEPVSVFTPPKNPVANQAPAVVERNTAPVRSATAADGTHSSPDTSPAQARWQADHDAITRGNPWLAATTCVETSCSARESRRRSARPKPSAKVGNGLPAAITVRPCGRWKGADHRLISVYR